MDPLSSSYSIHLNMLDLNPPQEGSTNSLYNRDNEPEGSDCRANNGDSKQRTENADSSEKCGDLEEPDSDPDSDDNELLPKLRPTPGLDLDADPKPIREFVDSYPAPYVGEIANNLPGHIGHECLLLRTSRTPLMKLLASQLHESRLSQLAVTIAFNRYLDNAVDYIIKAETACLAIRDKRVSPRPYFFVGHDHIDKFLADCEKILTTSFHADQPNSRTAKYMKTIVDSLMFDMNVEGIWPFLSTHNYSFPPDISAKEKAIMYFCFELKKTIVTRKCDLINYEGLMKKRKMLIKNSIAAIYSRHLGNPISDIKTDIVTAGNRITRTLKTLRSLRVFNNNYSEAISDLLDPKEIIRELRNGIARRDHLERRINWILKVSDTTAVPLSQEEQACWRDTMRTSNGEIAFMHQPSPDTQKLWNDMIKASKSRCQWTEDWASQHERKQELTESVRPGTPRPPSDD